MSSNILLLLSNCIVTKHVLGLCIEGYIPGIFAAAEIQNKKEKRKKKAYKFK